MNSTLELAGEYTFEIGIATVPSAAYAERQNLLHEELASQQIRLCLVPLAGQFAVIFRRRYEIVQLLHYRRRQPPRRDLAERRAQGDLVSAPAITVVTPSFNQGRFIRRTIESVLSQNVPGLEYLVFDAVSTDETAAVLREYSGRLTATIERDTGQADAVNKGLRAARGDIIGWLNSDDVYYPGALAQVLEIFAANPWIDVIYGDADHIDEHDGVMEAYYTEPFDYEKFKDVCFLCQPAVFFRRSVVERVRAARRRAALLHGL